MKQSQSEINALEAAAELSPCPFCVPSRTTNSRGWDIQSLPLTGGVVVINAEPYPCKCKAVTAMNAMPKPNDGDGRRVYEALKIQVGRAAK